jgi:flagellar biosynthetic protein FlhB
MAGDKHSKTEKPTGKRLSKARKEGQIPKHPEIGSWLSVLVATWMIPLTVGRGEKVTTNVIAQIRDQAVRPDVGKLAGLIGQSMQGVFTTVWPIAAVGTLTVIAAGLAQGGLHPPTKALGFKAKRLNPIAGLKRMFGPHGVQETIKSLVKVTTIGLLSWSTLHNVANQLVAGASLSLGTTIGIFATAVISLVRSICIIAVGIAIIDGYISHRRTHKGLMMTKQEVKDEHKQADGNPEIKQAIRSKQFQMSRNRMIRSVADADVVLANPTHVAVALKYERGKGAPRVVAKGAGLVAAKIRAEADKNRIPIVVDIPLARSIYKSVEVGREIPAELFTAVAKVLAFVMSLRKRGAHAGTHRNPHAKPLPAARAAA